MIQFTSANIRMWSMLGANGAFGVAALELPAIDNNVVMLSADLSFYSGLERFSNRFPERFFNMGIAEQNSVGIAAGLAKEGMNVFSANYATFVTTRSCDQVRVNLGYMKLGVKLVGCTAGLSIGILGPTHFAIEDIAIMRAIPNITIVSPADCTETVKATIAAAKHEGPMYLRLTGGMNNPIVYKTDYDFEIGKAIKLRDGLDVAIIAAGAMVHSCLEASKLLEEKGISCSVINMHTIKPIDNAALLGELHTKLLVTVEEHNIFGGLGGAVAENLAGYREKPPQLMIGISDRFDRAASYPYLLKKNGLTPQQIASRVEERFKEVLHS